MVSREEDEILYQVYFHKGIETAIETYGNCTEYPTSGIPNGGNTQRPNGGNTQRPEYPTEKLGILVVGYSGQNDWNTQQWNAQRRNTQQWNVIGNCTEYPTSGIPNDGIPNNRIPNNGMSSNHIRYNI